VRRAQRLLRCARRGSAPLPVARGSVPTSTGSAWCPWPPVAVPADGNRALKARVCGSTRTVLLTSDVTRGQRRRGHHEPRLRRASRPTTERYRPPPSWWQPPAPAWRWSRPARTTATGTPTLHPRAPPRPVSTATQPRWLAGRTRYRQVAAVSVTQARPRSSRARVVHATSAHAAQRLAATQLPVAAAPPAFGADRLPTRAARTEGDRQSQPIRAER
jgi:hypothetical protein